MKAIGRFLYRGIIIFLLTIIVQGVYFGESEIVTVDVIGITAVIGVIAAVLSELSDA